jgi:hypothetical protein
MSADKRDFADFKAFPGAVNSDTDNYEFPKLLKTTDTGKVREWAIFARLIKADSKSAETRAQNWNLLSEDQVKIKPKYFDQDYKLPEGTLVEIWTESGISGMKISRSAATYIEGKNIGKKNERNSFQQALITARGKFLKKCDEGSVEAEDLVKALNAVSVSDPNVKFYPMLAKNYKDFVNKVEYPVYIQPKLDGLRCIVYLSVTKAAATPTLANTTIDNVVMYSRQKKEYPFSASNNNIRKSLLPVLIKYYNVEKKESVFLDGELYKNNVSLQQINRDTRGATGELMEYHVYDMFYPSYTTEPFSARTILLAEIHKDLTTDAKKYIQLVSTHFIKSVAENDKLYQQYLDKKYEGTMIRSPEGPYLKSSVKKSETLRAKHLLKRKEVFSDEFEVVDYTSGESGKEVDAIVWICDAGNNNGATFNVVPNIPHAERYTIFKECQTKFKTKYQGRMLTCEYRGLSDKNIPLQVKAISFRDFE